MKKIMIRRISLTIWTKTYLRFHLNNLFHLDRVCQATPDLNSKNLTKFINRLPITRGGIRKWMLQKLKIRWLRRSRRSIQRITFTFTYVIIPNAIGTNSCTNLSAKFVKKQTSTMTTKWSQRGKRKLINCLNNSTNSETILIITKGSLKVSILRMKLLLLLKSRVNLQSSKKKKRRMLFLLNKNWDLRKIRKKRKSTKMNLIMELIWKWWSLQLWFMFQTICNG